MSSSSFRCSNRDALLSLCASLSEHPAGDSDPMQAKINRYLEEQTGASTAFLVPCEFQDDSNSSNSSNSGEIQQHEIAASLCIRVISRQSRNSPIRLQADKFLSSSSSSPSSSKSSLSLPREPLRLGQLSQAQRDFFQKLLNTKLTSFLAVPIYQSPSSTTVSLIACLANKSGRDGDPSGEVKDFSHEDAAVVAECFQVTLGTLLNTLSYEEERRLKKQCQSLLTVARNLFTHLDDVTFLLRQIMSEARQLTQAERCSLFLLDQNELVAKVFDGDIPESAVENGSEVRLPLDRGIAGFVARTGQILNIRDAQKHELFYRNIDQATGFVTKNILCFPIKDERKVIGVAELCNKMTGLHFTKFDEEIAMAFSAYCGLSILHSLMYKKLADAQHRSKLSNELMMYHMKIADEDVSTMFKTSSSSNLTPASTSIQRFHPDFSKFSFAPRLVPADDTPSAVLAMFQDLGLVHKFRIGRDTLARFILMVRRGYRDPPYHNWIHAFTVAHFCFLLVKNLQIAERKILSDLEILSLFVACLCHDLDHRGTNNSFQLTSGSLLAALYSSEGSVMERHHLAQAICILNTEGCNIVANLDDVDYTRFLDLMRHIILATDLADHIRIKPQLDVMIRSGYAARRQDHRHLLLSLLMTACDLSDQAKDWENSKNTAELVYSEFFSQGDLEKAIGYEPQQSMDREKAYIPALQIKFMDSIAVPVYKDLFHLFPAEAAEPYRSAETNRLLWGRAHEALERRGRNGVTGNVRELFRDDSVEREVTGLAMKMGASFADDEDDSRKN